MAAGSDVKTSQHYGNSTYTHGNAANGNSWNSTTQSYGNGYSSTDGSGSRGRNFSRQGSVWVQLMSYR